MVKKAIIAVILFLAGFFMLAQAAVPHHHHGQIACFNWLHCRGESGGHESEEHNHQHNNKSNSGCTLPDKEFLNSQVSVHFYGRFLSKSEKTVLQEDFQTTSLSFQSYHSSNFGLILDRLKPFNFSVHFRLESGSSGLRAPPVV